MFRTQRPLAAAARRATALRKGPISPASRALSTAVTSSQRSVRPKVEAPVVSTVLVWRTRYSTKKDEPPPVLPTKPDTKLEHKVAKEKLEKDPSHVSIESSFRQDNPEIKDGERDVSEGVAADVKSVKEALSLAEVPREAYALGLAGTIPYLATSFSTVYLTWNLRTQWPTDSNILNSIMVSHETAAQWLSHLEVIQLGYGAVIISFLGAIHWGLEWAEKAPKDPRTRYRYAVGVLAPAVAWPTLILPTQFALTAQFLAFVGLYFVDSRFTTRGWTPHWYGTYRFVLTAIVGGAIFISLVFRSKGGEEGSRLSSLSLDETMHGHPGAAQAYSPKWAKLEEKEREKLRKEKEEEEKKKKEEEEKKKEEEKKSGKKEKKDEKKGKKGDEAKASGEEEGEGDKGGDDEGDEAEDSDSSEDGDEKEGNDESKDDTKQGDNEKSDDKKGDDKQGDDKKGDDKKGSDKKEEGEADAEKQDEGDNEQKTDDDGGEGNKDSKKKDAKGDEKESKDKKGDGEKGNKKK